MKKTQEKILTHAVRLYNRKGVRNVRLQDIAASAGISAGNLSYHYKTQKALMEAVLGYLEDEYKKMSSLNMTFLENEDYLAVTKNYLGFQIRHRFFYRDIMEIMALLPEAKIQFEKRIQQVVSFTKNGMYLAIGKGLIKPEPHEGHYDFFAKNIWAILNSWLVEREVLGEERVSMEQIMLAVWEFHYPYFTEKGREIFFSLKKKLPEIIKAEVAVG